MPSATKVGFYSSRPTPPHCHLLAMIIQAIVRSIFTEVEPYHFFQDSLLLNTSIMHIFFGNGILKSEAHAKALASYSLDYIVLYFRPLIQKGYCLA